jgi:outer membrane lipoprotein-sorting protein
MKNVLMGTFMVLMLGFGFAGNAQTVDEILDKHFKAIGQEKLSKAQTIEMQGKMMNMGLEMPFVQKFKRESKFRMDATIMGSSMTQAFSGDKGWQLSPMMGITEPIDLTIEELKQASANSNVDGELYKYKERGSTIQFLGMDKFENADVYKLKLTRNTGDEAVYFINSSTYLPMKIQVEVAAQGMPMTVETIMSEYKEIDGIKMPHKIETRSAGMSVTVMIDKIIFNSPMDDSIFEKPKK